MVFRIGVEDVANIFQSIWSKLRDDTSAQNTTCSLPPFEGRLGYGLRSWVSSSTDASLKWYVQEEQRDEFLRVPLKRSEFFCTNLDDNWYDGNDAPIATIYDNTLELDQRKEFEYNPFEAAQSTDHGEDTLVDGRRSNNSSTIFSESSEEFLRPDSPTISPDAQPDIFSDQSSRNGLSAVTAHDDFRIDRAWPLPETPFTNIHLDVPERRVGRYPGPNRAGRFSEEVLGRGYQPKVRMPKGNYSMLWPDLGHQYEPQACVPPGPNSGRPSYSDHRHQNLVDTQCGREASIVEISETRFSDLDKDESGMLPLYDQFGEYHQTNAVVSALAPQVYTGNPDELNFSDHSTGGLRLANSRNSTRSRLWGMRSRMRSRLRDLFL